jgi:nitrate reductase NapAB chaperone NapD
MWISSFVVTLAADDPQDHPVQRALESLPAFTLGERQGARLPVVLEAPDGATARYWHEWVEQLPGVVQVDVAFVSFDESEPDDAAILTPCAPAISMGVERNASRSTG